MFLNTTLRDFEGLVGEEHEVHKSIISPPRLGGASTPQTDDITSLLEDDETLLHHPLDPPPPPPPTPAGLGSLVRMSSAELRLWSYFASFIAPRCALRVEAPNPYRDVVLRLAGHAPRGPLFGVVMAVAATQMHNLGHGGDEATGAAAWALCGRALRSLRRRLGAGGERETPQEVIVATVMMGFLEVSSVCPCLHTIDHHLAQGSPYARFKSGHVYTKTFGPQILQSCPRSWAAHVNYGQRLLLSQSSSLRTESPDLYHFAATWFVSHNVLAATACGSRTMLPEERDLLRSLEGHYVHTLTGCSKSLLCLLAEVTVLARSIEESSGQQRAAVVEPPASLKQGGTTTTTAPGDRAGRSTSLPAGFQKQRDSLERELYLHAPTDSPQGSATSGHPPGGGAAALEGEGEGEARTIAEVKRLAALLYFYARIDGASPHEGHMMRLTAGLLALVPAVSLRTNTLLWPLFVVGALGVRPEADGDRRVVLAALDALQRTRQLGCVRRARGLVLDVWRARDLRAADAAKGWAVLEGRESDVSLA